jgi:hypothetical protein
MALKKTIQWKELSFEAYIRINNVQSVAVRVGDSKYYNITITLNYYVFNSDRTDDVFSRTFYSSTENESDLLYANIYNYLKTLNELSGSVDC